MVTHTCKSHPREVGGRRIKKFKGGLWYNIVWEIR